MTDNFFESLPSNSYTIDLSKTRAPNVLSVTVENAVDPYIRNMLDIHVLHTGVAGLFGCPVEVTGDGIEGATLTFKYDPDNMRCVPAENLIGLYYNEEDNNYEEMLGVLDKENCTVSFTIDREGSYMLTDKYEWFLAWGYEIPEAAHPIVPQPEGGNFIGY